MKKILLALATIALMCEPPTASRAQGPRSPDQIIPIWPDLAPGETTRDPGQSLPRRADEDPPATRITGITTPQLHLYQPKAASDPTAAVLIFPGGGYNYVVADKEGSEAAQWLNQLGITALVVHYRTKQARKMDDSHPQPLPIDAVAPLQDGQRALSLLRRDAKRWNIRGDAIGVLGFSAGGQAAALVTTRHAVRAYAPLDEIDQVSCRPDFSMLIYPWRLADAETTRLNPIFTIDQHTPPTFLVHAHDDHATSLSSVFYYSELKRAGGTAELHIYQNGGHGYGMRPTPESDVATWPDRAADWLRRQGVGSRG